METIRVNEIFTSWQGEGRNTGMPATFVRFSGCNLSCNFCDTDHEGGETRAVGDVIREVVTTAYSFNVSNIIITGGEPLLQSGFNQIAEELWLKGYRVYLETNGTIYQPGIKYCRVVCSPKVGGAVNPKVDMYVREYKYIIEFDSPIDAVDGLPKEVSRPGLHSLVIPSDHLGIQPCDYITVQPCDYGDLGRDRSRVALSRAKSISRDYGYHLSIQVHKLIGVR